MNTNDTTTKGTPRSERLRELDRRMIAAISGNDELAEMVSDRIHHLELESAALRKRVGELEGALDKIIAVHPMTTANEDDLWMAIGEHRKVAIHYRTKEGQQ